MTWIGEIVEVVAQGFWEGGIESAYNRWEWIGDAAALVSPLLVSAIALWIVVR